MLNPTNPHNTTRQQGSKASPRCHGLSSGGGKAWPCPQSTPSHPKKQTTGLGRSVGLQQTRPAAPAGVCKPTPALLRAGLPTWGASLIHTGPCSAALQSPQPRDGGAATPGHGLWLLFSWVRCATQILPLPERTLPRVHTDRYAALGEWFLLQLHPDTKRGFPSPTPTSNVLTPTTVPTLNPATA